LSLAQLREHREVWSAKPILQRVYAPWFERILGDLPPRGLVLEVGAGPGTLTEHVRRRRPELRVLASDLTPTPWNDVVADALRLPLGHGSISGIAGLDVLHHLARPEAFFEEAARVLRPGAPLALVEPWVTPLSYPVYRFLHQEGCTLGIDPRDPFGVGSGKPKQAFDGDGALSWKIVRSTRTARWSELGFEPPRVELLSGFAYLMSLGFRKRSLLPAWAAPSVIDLDERLGFLAPLVGLRAYLCWRRTDPRA
jgi:SAM-dependent methyltransferase